jgi:hypothetical protein
MDFFKELGTYFSDGGTRELHQKSWRLNNIINFPFFFFFCLFTEGDSESSLQLRGQKVFKSFNEVK